MPELDLAVAIDAIQRRFGEHAMLAASRLAAIESWPSGLEPVDRLTGIGGLPRGRLSLLSGRGTCGKLSLGLSLLARGSRELSQVVLVDPSRSFDPWTLAGFGANLDRVLAIRPRDAAGCGEAALTLARAGCGLLVVLLPARVLSAADAWLPALEGAAGRSGSVVVAIAEEAPPALAHSSSFTIGFERTGWVIACGEPVGLRARLRCLKNRVAAPGGEAELEIQFAGLLPAQWGGVVRSATEGSEECLVRSAAV